MLMPTSIKADKQKLFFASVILFFLLSFVLLLTSVLNNSQAEGMFLPEIRLVGEYKIGDGEWKPIVEGEHIPATRGDIELKGVLEFGDLENNEVYGLLSPGTLVSINLNHINFSVTSNGEVVYVSDNENPYIGEDACGHVWQSFVYSGEDGYIEATIRNYHKFGNETAVDELLSSLNVYVGDYSEKMALSSGQEERLIAIIIMIVAFVILGVSIFSRLLYPGIFRTSLFSGLLVFSAGLYFLFKSRAIYLWFDTVIVNTFLTGLSAMAYVMFACVLIKGLFTGKIYKIANAVTLIYSLFIVILVAVTLFSKIYFFDLVGIWVIGAFAVDAIFIVLSLLYLKNATNKQKAMLTFIVLGLLIFIADIIAACYGLWQTGLASKIYFLVGFIVSVFAFLHVVPKNIDAVQKADQLEKEKITLDAELAQSRISTLMSQIHPHFIYNTLGSIEQLCELDPPKAAKLVHDFSRYLRGNFSELDNAKLIRVSKELEHTEYYISIEKVRFPDIEFETEMTCCDFCLPALTIQPIVENAVKHGILKREQGGTVKVKTYETDSSYFITVKDNGVGFDVIELQQKKHVGLRNIRSRLDAMCGGVLHIESIIGVGTKITVEIPKGAL